MVTSCVILKTLLRFGLIQRTGQACTALTFNIKRPTEILVALADYTVRCYDTGMVVWYNKFSILHYVNCYRITRAGCLS